jgi:pullulanase
MIRKIFPILAWILCASTAFAVHEIVFPDMAVPFPQGGGDWNTGKIGIAAEFTQWNEVPMVKGADGKWRYTIEGVEPGTYEFKFKVNGQWEDGANRKIQVTPAPVSLTPQPYLYYHKPAQKVFVTGSWVGWTKDIPMERQADGTFRLDVRGVVPTGQHEFKFKPDGNWESGANRTLFINDDGLIFTPLLESARLEEAQLVSVTLRARVPREQLHIEIPEVGVAAIREVGALDNENLAGFSEAADKITFVFDENVYQTKPRTVNVAGAFNNWTTSDPRWSLARGADGVWRLEVDAAPIRAWQGPQKGQFKFVINGGEWQNPPPNAPNAVEDGMGNVNLSLDAMTSATTMQLEIMPRAPLALNKSYEIIVSGLPAGTEKRFITPGRILEQADYDGPIGVTVKVSEYPRLGKWISRFATRTKWTFWHPRATRITVELFENARDLKPVSTMELVRDVKTSVWTGEILADWRGKSYAVRVDGPRGDAEEWDYQRRFADPWARAVYRFEHGGVWHERAIVPSPDVEKQFFGGWTDQNFKTPRREDLVIYECHVQNMTVDPNSGAPEHLRGKFAALTQSASGRGLLHLTELGINAVEFMPLHEFGYENFYNWGYSATHFWAPEANFATKPELGSGIGELKALVNRAHELGLAVIVDVVYNHVGPDKEPFTPWDKKQWLRLNRSLSRVDARTGCGNEVKTENPFVTRFLIDSLKYWVTEFHVDGFRFDLAAALGVEPLRAVERELRMLKPDIILTGEPWDAAGKSVKRDFTGGAWSWWNGNFDYSNTVKDFALGRGDKNRVRGYITGEQNDWAARPFESINYVESHDNMALADYLSPDHGKSGHPLGEFDKARNRICAAILMTSLGIPMLSEGQELLRSKGGNENSYDQLAPNIVRWHQKTEYAREFDWYRGLVHLRNSNAGRAFRLSERPPPNYYQFFDGSNPPSLGYIVNGARPRDGGAFVVLINANALQPATFQFNLPWGNWKLIAENGVIDAGDAPPAPTVQGNTMITDTVAPLDVKIYRSD